MGLTRGVLRRPVTTVLVVLCLIVFGLTSIFSAKLELTPEMEMPMMVISAVYPGASPDDVNELVTQPIEDAIGTLNGIKGVTSSSSENVSIVLLEYEYGMDMDKAYSDLKKKMDNLTDLPDDVDAPVIMEFNINEAATMTLAVNSATTENLYNYVEQYVSPEFEKLSSVASVDISGGQSEYIRVELIPEKLDQYHLNMSAIASSISAANFSYPAGSAIVGSQDLSVTTAVEYDTMESLKQIPISAGNGNTIYLEDVANIYGALEDASSIGRYNGLDTISLGIKKQQESSAGEVSKAVNRTIEQLKRSNPELEIVVVNDNSEMIDESLASVFQTMIMAVIISMVILFLFFGDWKASMIVGTSIPMSILVALIMMQVMGFSLNVITLSSLVLGVGMMVDNSIVVLESCFRSTEGKGFDKFHEAALKGSGVVLQSIIGSTATTCVVFLPLALLSGMSGQMFKPLGFTIVFCMLASLISAMTLVPLCYVFYRPQERKNAPLSGMVTWLQKTYRAAMKVILPKKKTVMFTSIALLIISLLLVPFIRLELMPANDQGTITVSIETRPGLTIEITNEILREVEAYITQDENLDSYLLSYSGSGLSMGGTAATLPAYLKDDRTMPTSEVLRSWKPVLTAYPDCQISLSEASAMSMMTSNDDTVSYILQSTQYDDLKEVSDTIVNELTARDEITRVHSTLENSAPVIKISVDPVQAAAEGMVPVQVAATVNSMLSGTEATTLEVNGEDVSVMVEYPEDEYDTLDKVKGIVLSNGTGGSVGLTDIADVYFEDSPASILRSDKQYQVTISGDLTEFANENTETQLYNEVVSKHLNDTVTRQMDSVDERMMEEFAALGQAIATAAFLIFVVMAMQFESPKFSIMVMTTIPFSLIGSFGLLFLADASISMATLLGFLMLIGTVVNNGILYVDTANQYRAEMDMNTALVEAGTTRLRPILMTTLTTVVSMIPMAFGYGDSGEMMQGLALVNVGGLLASTVLSLLMLPVYYTLMNRKRKPQLDVD